MTVLCGCVCAALSGEAQPRIDELLLVPGNFHCYLSDLHRKSHEFETACNPTRNARLAGLLLFANAAAQGITASYEAGKSCNVTTK